VGKPGPLQEKKLSNLVRAVGRSGPADPVATTFCTQIWQRDSNVFRFYISKILSQRKTIHFATQLFSSYFRQKFSFLAINFTHVRVGIVPLSSTSDIFSFLPIGPIPRVVMAQKGMA
jgi:hypothetical protein